MTKAGDHMALAVSSGAKPAARIWHQGHSYVPESELQEALRRFDERNRTAQNRAVSNGLKLERIAELESEIAALEARNLQHEMRLETEEAISSYWKESAKKQQMALEAIIKRSNNDPLGTSKVNDMREIARRALAAGDNHERI